MDPDATLREMQNLAEDIRELWDVNEDRCDPKRLAELVLAMDRWLAGGGFLPLAWKTCIDRPTG